MIRLRTTARDLAAPLARRVTTTTWLRRWLVLGVAIGVIAGLGAAVFSLLLDAATHFFLGVLGGFKGAAPLHGRWWALPLVVAGGGLVSGLLVFRLAPEAEGHGTDAAIDAVHHNPRGIRGRAVVVKILASAVTIGSGGSAGREGPTAQISAGFASLLARILNLSPADARIAVATGIGSGIGAIFKAPLGGAVLAVEILYRDDMEPDAFVPGLVASVVSYAVFGALRGFAPMFAVTGLSPFTRPAELGWFALIGTVCGLVGLAYASGFYGIAGMFGRLRLPRELRPALGGLLVGLMGLVLPEVLGTGYGFVQLGLERRTLLALPLAAVLLLPLARIVATGCSIGSGGSGGIFGPGMVIGAFTGAAIWRLLEPFAPAIPHQPSSFVLVGMMACFGSISRAPLAVMLMVVEMTASLEALAPAMLAVGIATLLVRRSDATIYRSQLRTRADSAAHRLQQGVPLLGGVRCAEVMAPPRVVLSAAAPVEEALAQLEHAGVPGAPVTDAERVFVGTTSREALGRARGPVRAAVDPTAGSVQADAALDTAVEALTTTPDPFVTVLDAGMRPVGILTTADVVRGQRRAVAESLGRLSKVAGSSSSLEVRVGDAAPAAGEAISSAGLPAHAVVLAVERGGALVLPDGATVLRPGDLVTVLLPESEVPALRGLLTGRTEAVAE